MYYITKRIEIAGSHFLNLPYQSKCTRMHGHNWIITIHCRARELNAQGMVADFSHIKAEITERLDHQCLNDVLPFNPTAENIAHWIAGIVDHCCRVDVQESEGNVASYVADEPASGISTL